MSASRKRTDLQDVTVSELTVDLEQKKAYLTFHFVTIEFDYQTGMDFVAQLRAKLDLIAPDLPMKPTPSLHDNGK